ncbi:MAG: sugar transferase [Candidatus Yanofskybacteria bacterium]|nr:sugar transferase [Candidatus Yanofskybacteria bacterium]
MKKFLVLMDLILLYASLVLTIFIRYPEQFGFQFKLHLLPFSILFLLWLGAFYISNLYDKQLSRNDINFYSALARASLFAIALSIAFFYLIPLYGITPRTNLVIFTIIFSLLILIARTTVNNVREKGFKRSLLLVGANTQSLELAQYIRHNPQLGYSLRAIININQTPIENLQEYQILEGIEAIKDILHQEHIQTVVLSPEAYQTPELIEIFFGALGKGIVFHSLPYFYEHLTGRVPLSMLTHVWFLENIKGGRKQLYEMAKRGFDIMGALVLGIPTIVLLPIISLTARWKSPGPIFYRQLRLGQSEKPFTMIKFRTMHTNAEKDGAVWTQENDPRITRIGKFLRKTRLDELPQLWNILKGEMSFVGPRSERPEFHEQLIAEVPYYKERYLIKPGATGWAQLQKSYYASVTDTKEKLQYDLYYIKNRSFLLDLGILLKTINLVLRAGGR